MNNSYLEMSGLGGVIGLSLIVLGIAMIIFMYCMMERYLEVSQNTSFTIPTLIVLLLFISSIWFLYVKGEKAVKLSFSYNIYALQDTSITSIPRTRVGASSSYYFEEDFKYFHMADYKEGKKMYSVDKNKSYIVEQENVQPHIEVYVNTLKDEKDWRFKLWNETVNEYKIVVPKDTITKDFKIDMEK